MSHGSIEYILLDEYKREGIQTKRFHISMRLNSNEMK